MHTEAFHWVARVHDPDQVFEPCQVNFRNGEAYEVWTIGSDMPLEPEFCVIAEQIVREGN